MTTSVSALSLSKYWSVWIWGGTSVVKTTIRKTDISLSIESRWLRRFSKISNSTLSLRNTNWVRSSQITTFTPLWLKMNALNSKTNMQCSVIRNYRLIRNRINMNRSTVFIVCIRNWNSCNKTGDHSSKSMLTNCWIV